MTKGAIMNDMQRWAFIEDLFKQMIELCNELMRSLEEDEVAEWHKTHPTLVPFKISNGEAKKLLENATDYLENGK